MKQTHKRKVMGPDEEDAYRTNNVMPAFTDMVMSTNRRRRAMNDQEMQAGTYRGEVRRQVFNAPNAAIVVIRQVQTRSHVFDPVVIFQFTD